MVSFSSLAYIKSDTRIMEQWWHQYLGQCCAAGVAIRYSNKKPQELACALFITLV